MTFRVGGAAKHGDKRIWIGIGGDRIGKRPLIVIGGGAREIEMDLHPLQRIGGRTGRHPRASQRAPGAEPVAGFALPAGLVGDPARIARLLRSLCSESSRRIGPSPPESEPCLALVSIARPHTRHLSFGRAPRTI